MSTRRVYPRWVIQPRDSAAFARLSGDFNPLHLEPETARRTLFGETVVHGMHTLLATFDRCLGGEEVHLQALRARFLQPLRHGQPVRIEGGRPQAGRFAATVDAEGTVLRVEARLGAGWPEVPGVVPRGHAPKAAASHGDLECLPRGGRLEPCMAPHLLKELFPRLGAHLPAWDIAVLLAATRVLGMEVGEGGVLAGLRLTRCEPQGGGAWLSWRCRPVQPRMGLLGVRIEGAGVRADLEAFFRPETLPWQRQNMGGGAGWRDHGHS